MQLHEALPWGLLLMWWLLVGCQSPRSELAMDMVFGWDDLSADFGSEVEEDDGELFKARVFGTAALPHASTDVALPATNLLVASLKEPGLYERGVLARFGTAKVFLAHRDKIPDNTRLYWVMVKTLSEKYGCFMRQKLSLQDRIEATCKDGRQIVFWPSKTEKVIQFISRQFDAEGFEITVRNRRIVRIGLESRFASKSL